MSEGEDEQITEPAKEVDSFSFSGPQRRLYEALSEHSSDLAAMYRGALQILEEPFIDDRFAMSAHNFRELIEKLPSYIEVPRLREEARERFSLKVEVKRLEEGWKEVKENSDCFDGEGWDGEVGGNLKEFFEQLEALFLANSNYNPERREAFLEWVRGQDPSPTPLAAHTEKRLLKEWSEVREFFLSVCHHGKEPGLDEFEEHVRRLEDLILPRLVPQPFENQEVLDDIIQEAEQND